MAVAEVTITVRLDADGNGPGISGKAEKVVSCGTRYYMGEPDAVLHSAYIDLSEAAQVLEDRMEAAWETKVASR